MAIRPIDAVQVLHNINLHRRPTPVSEFESGFNDGLNQAMWEITHAPTLTQPNEGATDTNVGGKDNNVPTNEPLTLEELRDMNINRWVWIQFPGCSVDEDYWERAPKAFHMYSHEDYGKTWIAYRRPPEGEGGDVGRG